MEYNYITACLADVSILLPNHNGRQLRSSAKGMACETKDLAGQGHARFTRFHV